MCVCVCVCAPLMHVTVTLDFCHVTTFHSSCMLLHPFSIPRPRA